MLDIISHPLNLLSTQNNILIKKTSVIALYTNLKTQSRILEMLRKLIIPRQSKGNQKLNSSNIQGMKSRKKEVFMLHNSMIFY